MFWYNPLILLESRSTVSHADSGVKGLLWQRWHGCAGPTSKLFWNKIDLSANRKSFFDFINKQEIHESFRVSVDAKKTTQVKFQDKVKKRWTTYQQLHKIKIYWRNKPSANDCRATVLFFKILLRPLTFSLFTMPILFLLTPLTRNLIVSWLLYD